MTTINKPRFEIIEGKCVIPDGITAILNGEFMDCKELKRIEIPETVTSIGHGAFFYCTSLEEIKLPASLTEIGFQAFEGCFKLKSITIPDGVSRLHSAFSRCTGLKEITISKSVIEIETNPFCRCRMVDTIEVAEDNPAYRSESNCCLTKDGETLIFGCKSSVIPNGVKTIKDFAFYGCSGLKSIRIPDGVEIIDNWAFGHCTKLTSINIPESVREIIVAAFAGSPIKDIYLSARNPDDCVDLKEGLKYNRLKYINLHVPEEAVYAYKGHPFFKKFQMIKSYRKEDLFPTTADLIKSL